MEKRNFLRTNYLSRAEIRLNEEVVSGEIINLSLNGAMVKTNGIHKLNMYERIEIEMFLTNEETDIKINSSGVVVRLEKDEIGIRFETMDLNSFTHLRNIIAYNTGEYDKIMEEMINNSKDKV
jgi:c-di-GMP-binding flagellar brake protein YcgR